MVMTPPPTHTQTEVQRSVGSQFNNVLRFRKEATTMSLFEIMTHVCFYYNKEFEQNGTFRQELGTCF